MASTFERDLEFVQLLCNPEYVRWLYDNNYFTNREFKSYLRHLLYFQDYEYGQFLLYPQCIPILRRLSADDILTELSDEGFYARLADDQHHMWRHRQR